MTLQVDEVADYDVHRNSVQERKSVALVLQDLQDQPWLYNVLALFLNKLVKVCLDEMPSQEDLLTILCKLGQVLFQLLIAKLKALFLLFRLLTCHCS